MNVILIKNAIVNGGAYFSGTEIEVDTYAGKRLIQRGLAVDAAKQKTTRARATEHEENEE